jgi:hypothetical protein
MTMHEGTVAPTGTLGLAVSRNGGPLTKVTGGLDHPSLMWPSADTPGVLRAHGLPRAGLTDEVNAWRTRNLPHLWRGVRRARLAKALGIPTHYGALFLTVIRGNGDVVPYGLASMRVVTDTGVAFIVDAFQNLVELENMKYHGFGTGGTAEAASQTALVTELTTQYNPDNTRPTGSTTEGAANVYRTVGTVSPDSGGTIAVTEHGVFSQAATGGGVMIDRSLFAAVNLTAGADSLQATYDLTFPSGS